MQKFEPHNFKYLHFEKGSKEDLILKELAKISHDFDQKKLMTKAVKLAIVCLGHLLKFKVYARVYTEVDWANEENKLNHTKELGIMDKNKYQNKEWLYDVHWYTDVSNPENDMALEYMPKTFELACECEWSKNKAKSWNQNKKDIGYDFQKLLFSNAKLNLFICRCHKDKEMDDLSKYFKNSIKEFNNLYRGSKFLIVCFREDKLFYLTIKKQKNSDIL